MLTPAVNEEIESILANNPVLKKQKTPSITVEVAEPENV